MKLFKQKTPWRGPWERVYRCRHCGAIREGASEFMLARYRVCSDCGATGPWLRAVAREAQRWWFQRTKWELRDRPRAGRVNQTRPTGD